MFDRHRYPESAILSFLFVSSILVSYSSDYDTAADATETSSYISAKGYQSR